MPDTVEADRKRRFCREAVGEDHGCENSAVKIDKYTNIKAGQAAPANLKARGGYDWGLLAVVMALLTVGLIMVFSASYARALVGFGSPFYFIARQIMWTGLGLAALIIAANVNYTLLERFSIPLMGLALLMLLAVIPFGTETYGAVRTLLGGSVQPSEPAKIVIIIYVSAWLASKGSLIQNVRVGLVPFSVLMGIVTVLIVTQPDISTAILIVTTASLMFFIAGAKMRQLLVIGIGIAVTFALVINYSDYAGGRVARYWDGLQNPLESAEWQAVQSVQAMINGGPVGVGIGNSVAKLPGYLPVSWSDNIFAIIGEELGLLGALFVILLFATLCLPRPAHRAVVAGQFWHVVGYGHHFDSRLAGAAQRRGGRGCGTGHRRHIALHQLWRQFIGHALGCGRYLAQHQSI